MAVITRDGYRRRGLGTIVAARTVLECERLGFRTWWNTSLDNVGSASIARSLGYRTERHYQTLAWEKADAINAVTLVRRFEQLVPPGTQRMVPSWKIGPALA